MKSASAKRKIVCKAKAVRFEGKKSEVTEAQALQSHSQITLKLVR